MEKASDFEGIKISHLIRGRVRFKVPKLKHNKELANEIQERLGAVNGIQRIETNTLTGSVLLLYHPEQIVTSDSLNSLLESLGRVFPELNMDKLKAWLTANSDLS